MTLLYFSFIGLLTSNDSGRSILDHHRIFDVLIPLSLLHARDDLSNVVVRNLEYNSLVQLKLSFHFYS